MYKFFRKLRKANIEIDIDLGVEHILGGIILIIIMLWMLSN